MTQHSTFFRLSRFILVGTFILGSGSVPVLGQNITVTGATWSVALSNAGMLPGDPLFLSAESPVDQILVDIHGQKDSNWQISIYKVDALWDNANLSLSVRRTGEGSGGGTASGGLSYVAVRDIPTVFFTGGKNRSNIPCQYRLDPILPSAGSYSTTVYYTIIGI